MHQVWSGGASVDGTREGGYGDYKDGRATPRTVTSPGIRPQRLRGPKQECLGILVRDSRRGRRLSETSGGRGGAGRQGQD